MAQYSLALIFLDGVDLFYSCDLAAELLHAAATRGPWADIMNTASYLL
jgi:SEL1 protein